MKNVMSIFALCLFTLISLNATNAQASVVVLNEVEEFGEICSTTDYWITDSQGNMYHIYFTVCIEEEMAEVAP